MTSLHWVLRLNAASCLGFGTLFVLFPSRLGQFLGDMPTGVVWALGVGLLINGAHLGLASRRTGISRVEILWFSFGDFTWFLASCGLVAWGLWVTTTLGQVTTLGVALGVAGLGIVQLSGLALLRTGQLASAHWRGIARSWLSLPGWVKAWLLVLNLVFLAAPLALPWGQAGLILLAYAASGPLLLAFAAQAGGMTRAMGLGHLVPWSPLVVWLLSSEPMQGATGAAATYKWILMVVVLACLAMDIYDLMRWARGERGVLGADLMAGRQARP